MAYAALLLTTMAMGGCFSAKPEDVAGGGGVETTEGNLASLAGSPAGARITAIPADFDPSRNSLPDSLTVTADSLGAYRFKGLLPGRYNIEAWHPKYGTRCFQAGLALGKGARIAVDTLAAPGRLRLRWDGSRKGILHQQGRNFRLSLGGLESDSGGVILDSLPAGVLPPFSFVASAADTAKRKWTDSVAVTSGGLAEILAYGEWAHQARIDLDPGSMPGDTLAGFPMLVRLSRPAFAFTEAEVAGADLRFSTPAGEPLAYAIERWDTAAGRAEIWVRMKTLQMGGAGHAMLMHWGNPGAAAPSLGNAATVFDTADGHVGVWHMDETGAGNASLRDATRNSLKTIAKQLASETSDSAAIGTSQVFDGKAGYAYAQDEETLQRKGPLMLSAWIAPGFAGESGNPRTILAKWEASDSAGYILGFTGSGKTLRFTIGIKPEGGGPNRVFRLEAEPPDFAAGEWHQVAATYDGVTAAIWWDGVQLAGQAAGPGTLPTTARDIVIGALGDADPLNAEFDFFQGRMDEARVGRTVRTAAWLGLEYATQRPGASVLHIQKTK